jgi:uncharacterized protein YjbJ (UPF0337 family)
MTTQEDTVMQDDMSEARWQQVGGQVQIWWSKITDQDVERIGGSAERLADVLQHKCGYTAQHAELQSILWMRKHQDGAEAPA